MGTGYVGDRSELDVGIMGLYKIRCLAAGPTGLWYDAKGEEAKRRARSDEDG